MSMAAMGSGVFCCKTTIVGKYCFFSVDHHPESKKIFGPIENQNQQNRAYLVGGWAYLAGDWVYLVGA